MKLDLHIIKGELMAFCSACGNEIEDSVKFCQDCGKTQSQFIDEPKDWIVTLIA
tara:strand:- start:405 stop:566 length:162 start_codon:yes stop_codon:yes gene_type:complete